MEKEIILEVISKNPLSKKFYLTEDGHIFADSSKSFAVDYCQKNDKKISILDRNGEVIGGVSETTEDEPEDYTPVMLVVTESTIESLKPLEETAKVDEIKESFETLEVGLKLIETNEAAKVEDPKTSSPKKNNK
jgi:hypothetical protein